MVAKRNKGIVGNTFGAKIFEILEKSKLYRKPDGAIEGWGLKWLP